jgi:hypothetical protein
MIRKATIDKCPATGKPIRVDDRRMWASTMTIPKAASDLICIIERGSGPRLCPYQQGCTKTIEGRVVDCRWERLHDG